MPPASRNLAVLCLILILTFRTVDDDWCVCVCVLFFFFFPFGVFDGGEVCLLVMCLLFFVIFVAPGC